MLLPFPRIPSVTHERLGSGKGYETHVEPSTKDTIQLNVFALYCLWMGNLGGVIQGKPLPVVSFDISTTLLVPYYTKQDVSIK